LRSAICATRSKAPRSDTDHTGLSIWPAGIAANGKVAESFRAQAVQGPELTR